MAKLIKKLATLVLVLAVFAGTLYIESNSETEAISIFESKVVVVPQAEAILIRDSAGSQSFDTEQRLEPGDEIVTDEGSTANIMFDENGIIRIGASSSLIFRDELEGGYFFELKGGRAWINSTHSSSGLNILAGAALFMPRGAAFDLTYDDVVTEVSAFSNHVNVGLIDPGYEAENILLIQDGSLINSFLVAQGGKASIHLSKVVNNSEVLGRLLYSKLVKEFKYALMDMNRISNDRWISSNLVADEILLSIVDEEKLNTINNRGLKFGSLDSMGYKFGQFMSSTADLLTFFEDRRMDRLIDGIFDHLRDAEYLLSYGRVLEAKERLNLFAANLTTEMAKGGDDFNIVVLDKLRDEYSNLSFVLPNHNLYEIKNKLSDVLLQLLGNGDEEILEKMGLIRDYLNYVYALADTDVLQAKLALELYYQKIGDFVIKHKSEGGVIKALISQDNQIMDNLLRQYSQFYQDSVFAMKYYLETQWLNLIPDGRAKIEEQQTIISTKIDFLKQLQNFFLDQKVTLGDARKIVLRLVNEIEDLKTSEDVGVSALFALRLKDYGNFLRFLNSTNVTALKGASPQKKYEEFLVKQEEQVSIEEAISEFLGEEPSNISVVTLEKILEQIRIDFEAVGVDTVQLGTFAGLDQRYIDVRKGIMDDITFTARYEWDNKQISQIRVGSKVISQNPIRLSNLPLLLKPKSEQEENLLLPPADEVEEFDEPKTSRADQVAKILLMKKLQSFDITAAEGNIIISNAEKQLYVVNGAVLLSNPSIQVAFKYNNKDNLVTSLSIRTQTGDRKLEGSYPLSEVSRVATELYEGSYATESEDIAE